MLVSDRQNAAEKHRAIDFLNQDRLDDARLIYQNLLGPYPKDAEAWLMLGVVEGRGGNFSGAERSMRNALSADPGSAEAWLGLGQALDKQGRKEAAGNAYLKAVDLNPRLAEARVALGRWYQARSYHRHAIEHFEAAIEIGISRPELMLAYIITRPKLMEVYADALRFGGEAREALEVYLSLSREHPDNSGLLQKIGNTYIQMSRLDLAKQYFRNGIERDPDNLLLRMSELRILRMEGRDDEALEIIRPLFDSATDNLEVALMFATLCNRIGACDAAIERLETLLQRGGLGLRQTAHASFELGRLHDAAGSYDQAFAWFRRGNDLIRGHYDRSSEEATVSALIDGYSSENLIQASRAGNRDRRPVFIVGMPRSGTSLVEQILSSHPDVHGAGELPLVADWLRERRKHQKGTHVELLEAECESFTTDALDELAKRYLDYLDEISSGERYVTDKMPSNFLWLGPISLILPGARVIHCRRDPLDTCLSCYFQLFGGFHPYSNDLEDLACYYRNYQRLMAHWKEVLDLPILDVDYQALVAGQEAETRRLLDFLELDWDDRCLQYYRSGRPTLTASTDQVNKPIYSSSVGRWKHYEKHIAPLIAELGAAAGVPGE